METYLLILMVTIGSSYGGGVSINTIEIQGVDNCRRIGYSFVKKNKAFSKHPSYQCIKKSK